LLVSVIISFHYLLVGGNMFGYAVAMENLFKTLGLGGELSAVPAAPISVSAVTSATATFAIEFFKFIGGMTVLMFPVTIPAMILTDNNNDPDLGLHNDPMSVVHVAIAVCACAAFFLVLSPSYVPNPRVHAVLPYLRLPYVYSFAMACRAFTSERYDYSAPTFWRQAPLSLATSLVMLKVINLTAAAVTKESLAFVCALPLITEVLHRILGEARIVGPCNRLLHRCAPLFYGLSIALGTSTGALADLAKAVAYVFLISMREYMFTIGNAIRVVQSMPDHWEVKLREGANPEDPALVSKLRAFLDSLSLNEGSVLYFYDLGLFHNPEGFRCQFIFSSQAIDGDIGMYDLRGVDSIRLAFAVWLPCLRVSHVEKLAASIRLTLSITKENVDFSDGKKSAILWTIARLFGLRFTLANIEDLRDPNVQNTLRAIIDRNGAHKIAIPGFEFVRNDPGNPFANALTLRVLPGADHSLIPLLRGLSPKITTVM
jgi:hypothetical protein